uniref:Uncharacterized protein n=1 Tax=Rhizophora mucronata TaxID=61149 RepID=A0A2P2P6V6_RHIMU
MEINLFSGVFVIPWSICNISALSAFAVIHCNIYSVLPIMLGWCYLDLRVKVSFYIPLNAQVKSFLKSQK